jgi:hypothetical protein
MSPIASNAMQHLGSASFVRQRLAVQAAYALLYGLIRAVSARKLCESCSGGKAQK